MPDFEIYKIKFEQSSQKKLKLDEQEKTFAIDKANMLFSGLFVGDRLNLYSTKKKKNDVETFDNKIWKYENKEGDLSGQQLSQDNPLYAYMNYTNVFLLRLNNNEIKKIVSRKENANGSYDYVEDQVDSHPYSYCVIDNRPGSEFIAIERSPAWKSDSDVVRNILQESLSNMFYDKYGIKIQFVSLVKPAKFIGYIQERIKRNDPPSKICLTIENPDFVTDGKLPKNMSNRAKEIIKLIKASNYLKSIITLFAGKQSEKYLNDKNEDLIEIVRLCASNIFSVSAHFKHSKVHKCGDKIKALIKNKKEYIDDFIKGKRVADENFPEYGNFLLVQWLDNNVKSEIGQYEEVLQILKPRKNRRR